MDTPALTVRPMHTVDVAAVVALESAASLPGWSTEAYAKELANPAARYLVAMEGPDLVAMGGIWLALDEAHVTTMAVAGQRRRRGLGRLILHHLLLAAEGEGMLQATLECRASNAAAQALYRLYGFYPVGARKRYYEDGEDAVIMTTEPFASGAFRDRFALRRAELASRFPALFGC